jgi:hypothetical protein
MKHLLLVFVFTLASGSAIAYESHEPIYINGNSGFATCDCVSEGNGTSSSPYVIEGYSIYNPGSGTYGIRIKNTTVYYIIRNVFVYGSDYGIYLYNTGANRARIEDSTVWYNNLYGIKLLYADGAVVDNTSVSASPNGTGVEIIHSDDVELVDVEACNNGGTGIYISGYSDDLTLYQVSADYNDSRGIGVTHSTPGSADGWTFEYVTANYNVDCGLESGSNTSGLTVLNSSFNSNGSIGFDAGGDQVTIQSSTFNSNGSTGIYLGGKTAIINNCEMESNTNFGLHNNLEASVIKNCNFEDNGSYGVYSNYYSNGNEFYGNNFIGNNNGSTQAYDFQGLNDWGGKFSYCYLGYFYYIGNYWDDHACGTLTSACTNFECSNSYVLDWGLLVEADSTPNYNPW